jgi:hypothetical protein
MANLVTATALSATDRVLPNAQNIAGGEFASGYNGSCGEYMTLGMLHTYDPAKWPMTGSELAALVREADVKYGAASSGAETMGSAVKQLSACGIALTWVACRLDASGHALPLSVDWKNAIKQWAGTYPIGLELANAQALRGDEAGLHFHFVLVAGLRANGNVLLVDGDRKDGTALYEHTLEELEAAIPCAYVRGTVAPHKPRAISHLTLGWPLSLQDIASQYLGGNLAWLKTYNHNLSNQPAYDKTWWTLPVGTVVAIPQTDAQLR